MLREKKDYSWVQRENCDDALSTSAVIYYLFWRSPWSQCFTSREWNLLFESERRLCYVCGVASGAEGKGLWISHHKHTNKLWGQQKRSASGHILSDWVSSLTFLCSIMRVELLWANLLSCIDNFWWDYCWTWYTRWGVIYSRQKWKDWEATWPCRRWIPNETKLKQEKEGKIN